MIRFTLWLGTLVTLLSCEQEQVSPASDTPRNETGTAPPIKTHCSAWGAPEAAATISDPTLDEISGIAVSRRQPGVLWVHEDSGADPVLTAISTSGQTLATLTLSGASSIDWEDLAIAPCGDTDCLWVGDFGDNSAIRETVQLLRVEEPTLTEDAPALEASVTVFPFQYPEGPRDAEALVVDDDGQPYVLTKRMDATTHLYRIPLEGMAQAARITTISTGETEGLPTATTAADLWPDGSRLLVRGYLRTFEVNLTETSISSAHLGPQTLIVTGVDLQGEAIAYDPADLSIWHVSEGVNPTLWKLSCAD
jgi:hypothetical protein